MSSALSAFVKKEFLHVFRDKKDFINVIWNACDIDIAIWICTNK